MRYFGQLLRVATVNLRGRGGRLVSSGTVYLTLINAKGRAFGPVLHEPGANDMTFSVNERAIGAAGFKVTATKTVSIGDALVRQVDPLTITYDLNSPMQEALDSSWQLSDTVGPFSVFKALTVKSSVWLTSYSNGTISHLDDAAYGDTWVTVHATSPVTLVRSMAYLPGWRATALSTTSGKSEALKVSRNGLIQQVTVPSGDWRIHFHYHAPYIELGLAASIVGVVLIIGVGAYLIVDERRRREDKVRS
jgi:hypothetical protein